MKKMTMTKILLQTEKNAHKCTNIFEEIGKNCFSRLIDLKYRETQVFKLRKTDHMR